MIGTTLAHYRILEKLGSGGMGDVYLALDTKLDREIALKTLPSQVASDTQRRRRFEREARAVAALNHRNIVTIHSVEESENSLFITMELVRGKTLSDIISAGSLSLEQFFELSIPLTDAVATAHAKSITHRDLKPANIMVAEDGTLKVLDFGLAKQGRESSYNAEVDTQELTLTLTAPGEVIGTVPYMSPEQIQGRALDTRSDVFSLGVIFYEMASGHRPFKGSSMAEVASSILRDEPTNLGALVLEYPEELLGIVSRCLEKNLHSRFATAGEVLAAIQTARSTPGLSIAHAPDSQDRTIAVLDFENMTGTRASDWLGTGIAETVTTDIKRLSGLSAIPRERVMMAWRKHSPEGSEDAALEVGRELKADFLIHGAFQLAGDQVRITGRILRPSDGTIIGSIKLDGTPEKIFELQDRILAGLLESAHIELSESKLNRIRRPETLELRAYEHYVNAQKDMYRMDAKAFERAEGELLKALELDSDYAKAHASLGRLIAFRYIFTTDPRDLQDGLQHLQKAISIDSQLAEPYVGLAYGYARLNRFEDAISAGEKAVELDRNNARAHYFYAVSYWLRAASNYQPGDWETASRILERSIELGPMQEASYMVRADALLRLGRSQEARETLEGAVAIETMDIGEDARFLGGETQLGWLDLSEGDLDSAERRLERSRLRIMDRDHFYAPQFLSLTLSCQGYLAEARGELDVAIDRFRDAVSGCERNARSLGMGRVLVRAEYGLARVLHHSGRVEQAAVAASRAETLHLERKRFDFSGIWMGADDDLILERAKYLEAAGRTVEANAVRGQAQAKGWVF